MAWITAGLLVVAILSFLQSIVYARELRRSYEQSITPHLTWQDPASGQRNENFKFTGEFVFAVRSVGPGDARLHFVEARMDTGDTFPILDIVIPATLPVNAQYTWMVKVPDIDVRLLTNPTQDTELRITLRYADLQGRNFYETFASFAADTKTLSESKRAFKDVDERAARRRETKWRPGQTSIYGKNR
jgi:hypothetical protein